jgi:AcrR family transcriptional regulator
MNLRSSTGSAPRWARRKEARPKELLEAALELFVERGFAATRLEDVAQRAGVSKGTLYLYYSGKEELFKAVVRESLVPVLDKAEDLVSNHSGDSIELFRLIIFGWWEHIGNTRLSGISKLVMAESGNFPELSNFYHQEFVARGMAMIASLLERGIALGDFREINASHLTQVIIAPLMMLMMWKHSFSASKIDPISPEIYLNNLVDMCLHGLLKNTSPTSE